jgi:hypothetical protein
MALLNPLNKMLAKAQKFGNTRPWPEWVNPNNLPVIEPVHFKKSLIWALNDYCGFNLPYDLAEQTEPESEGRILEL